MYRIMLHKCSLLTQSSMEAKNWLQPTRSLKEYSSMSFELSVVRTMLRIYPLYTMHMFTLFCIEQCGQTETIECGSEAVLHFLY